MPWRRPTSSVGNERQRADIKWSKSKAAAECSIRRIFKPRQKSEEKRLALADRRQIKVATVKL